MEFDRDYANMSRQQPVLAPGEMVLWRGKPQKKSFIATRALTLMPVALLWLALDMTILVSSFASGDEELFFLIPFFAFHLLPVWIWLGNILTAGRQWKNTAYFMTNKRIIIQSGFWAVNESSLPYGQIFNTQLHIGFLDKMFKTGDIRFEGSFFVATGKNRRWAGHAFEDLSEPQQAYAQIQRILQENHGEEPPFPHGQTTSFRFSHYEVRRK